MSGDLFRILDRIGAVDQSVCDGCDQCGSRCVAGVPMTRREYQAIQEYRRGAAASRVQAAEQQPKWLPYPGTEGMELAGEEPAHYQACRFRDSAAGQCSIYPVRPAVCRLFGYTEWLPCPIEKVTQPLPDGLAVMRAYVESGVRTFEEWELETGAPAQAA